jgi:4-hydroxy-tetrahydrodipicolinate synthase
VSAPFKGLEGLVAYSITPMIVDERVDESRLASLLDDLVCEGVDGINILGSSGAGVLYSEAERMRIAEVALAKVGGRVPVMVGTGALTTGETVRLSRHAARAGAASVLVVPIAYWRLQEHELVAHYHRVADAAGVPVCIYNNPRLTHTDMQPALIARIAAHPAIRHLKETSADLSRITEMRRLEPSVHIAAGRDGQALDALTTAGAQGWHSAMANIAAARCIEIFRHCQAGRFDDARAAWAPIASLTLFCAEHGLIRTLHAALDLMGKPVGAPRRPVLPLPVEERARLAALLDASILHKPPLGDAA